MDTQYCDECGLLHDPQDGECSGCRLIKENKKLREYVKDMIIASNPLMTDRLTPDFLRARLRICDMLHTEEIDNEKEYMEQHS